MTKILRSATIIPPELYVPRAADRQLRRVIEDMGRPGYILVARQMGKTNLLLSAKRALENDDNALVYVDLSNRHDGARECFRALIDTATETRPDAFSSVADTIGANRRTKDLPPHKEHENDLRALLRGIRGKLVIILDEIDALTLSSFSDQICSQIRSTYFARPNIPEFGRLTYILSGTADPSQLIKNSKLSPFNIGEQIYLEDFSSDEFAAFLGKAQIRLAMDVAHRVFFWCRGNPRMTWDVCSRVEDSILEGIDPTVASIDQIVAALYFEKFDQPPVDHIRVLVAAEKELQDAIIEIRYGKGDAISDEIARRLYLAGITGHARPAAVKNPVIDTALSDQWLRDIQRAASSLLELAKKESERGAYEEAIKLCLEYIEKMRPEGQELAFVNDMVSEAHSALGHFEESLAWLEQRMIDKHSFADSYYRQRHRMGVAYLQLGRYEESAECFEEVARESGPGRLNLSSHLNLAAALFVRNDDDLDARIENLNLEVREKVEGAELSEEIKTYLHCVATYNLARLYDRGGQRSRARLELEGALQRCPISARPTLLNELVRQEDDSTRRLELLGEIAETIISHRLVPVESRPGGDSELDLNESRMMSIMYSAVQYDEAGSFERLLGYLVSDPGNAWILKPVELMLPSIGARNRGAGRRLAEHLVRAAGRIGDAESLRAGHKWLAYLGTTREERSVDFERYTRCLTAKGNPDPLDRLDVVVLSQGMLDMVAESDFANARAVLEIARRFREQMPAEDAVILDFVEMTVAVGLGDQAGSVDAAERLLNEARSRKVTIVRADDLSGMLRQARSVVARANTARILDQAKQRVGRNMFVTVRYSDGRIVRAKMKRVETDLDARRCEIVKVG